MNQEESHEQAVVVLMGVSGAGKTTVGQALADRLGCAFVDADDLHAAASIAKMQRGESLTGADRAPWLADLRALINRHLVSSSPLVLACSALRAPHRAVLRVDERVCFAWLTVPRSVLERRLRSRAGHFAGAALLPSQLATLEPPAEHEAARVEATGAVPDIVQRVIQALGLEALEHMRLPE